MRLRAAKCTEDNGPGAMNLPAQPDAHAPVSSVDPVPQPRYLLASMRTHIVLLRFCALSFTTAILDNVVFYLLFLGTGTILGAQIIARAVSVFFNYRFVRSTVFCSSKGHHTLLPRYLALAAANLLLSYLGIRLLSAYTSLSVPVSKIVAETILFVTNFSVQRAFIFTHKPKPAN
jgi:putative flippase GtrA